MKVFVEKDTTVVPDLLTTKAPKKWKKNRVYLTILLGFIIFIVAITALIVDASLEGYDKQHPAAYNTFVAICVILLVGLALLGIAVVYSEKNNDTLS